MNRIITLNALLSLSLWLIAPLFVNAQTANSNVLLAEISKTYKGKTVDGLAHGKGKAKGIDSYVGEFKKGLPHGKGKYTYENGNVYNGYWQNGVKHGKGQFDYKIEGVAYTQKGYWQNGDYTGTTDPNASYNITSSAGIFKYEVTKSKTRNEGIIISIYSAMSKFVPVDLKVNSTSGQFRANGRSIELNNILSYPANCSVEYTIKVGDIIKQCKFEVQILQEGGYDIMLSND